MAAAANVSFDVLLGGKVTPEAIKALNDMEAKLKQFGANTKTINAAMSRAYKETFDSMSKESHKASGKMREDFKETFEKLKEGLERVKRSSEQLHESFNKMLEPLKKVGEFFGVTGVISGIAGAIGVEELIKHGTEVWAKREEARDLLAATLRSRGRPDLTPGYQEAIENLSKAAPIGYEASADMLRKLAATGQFRGPESAERIARAIVALSGGSREGAAGAFAGYERMLLSGRVMPKGLVGLSRGSGFNVLAQMARDVGLSVADLQKALGPKGALAGAQGLQLLNKAILELGEKAMPLLEARMKGMKGLFYRLSEDWENFLEKIGQIWDNVISPIANEINAWLDSINWEETFSALIEKSKEWGQTIRNVFDMVFNSPVAKRFQEMWEDFWRRMVGGEMYGPWVRAADEAERKAGKWHWARQPTEAGRRWMEGAAKNIEMVLNGIADFMHYVVDHASEILDFFKKLIEALILLQAIDAAAKVISLATAVTRFVSVVGEATAAIGLTETAGLVGALFLLVGAVNFLLSTTSKEQHANLVADLQAQKAAITEAHIARGRDISTRYMDQGKIEEGKRLLAESDEQYKRDIDSIDKKIDQETKAAEAAKNQAEAQDKAAKSTAALDKQLKTTTGNDLVHFDAAIGQATQSLLTLSSGFAGFGGGFGLGAGGVTGAHFTEYGPAVPGDQPGGATYDWNSYHHIGAWPSLTGPLRAGDVALGYGAQAFYHVMPGQMFTDQYGRSWRFADRSGSPDPMNVDVFRGAAGGIFNRATPAIIGEAGPEAVIPLGSGLAGGLTLNLNFGGVTLGSATTGDARALFRDFAETIAAEVQRAINAEHRRSAVV